MQMSPIMIVHVIAGTVSVLAGMTALFSRKGSRLHRIAGNVFFVAMLAMAVAGTYIAFQKSAMLSFLAGVFTCYLVATAWMTVKREAGKIGLFEFGALLIALGVGAAGIAFGLEAMNSDSGLKDGFSPAPYFFFGGLALLAAALDVRLLIRPSIAGAQRIARHLWRMCFALYIATGSLFTGPGAQAFSESIRGTFILSVPEMTVALLMIAWLIRIGIANWRKKGFVFPNLKANSDLLEKRN